MANFVNLTPHSISVFSITDCEEQSKGAFKSLILKEGSIPLLTLPSEGVARATTKRELVYTVNNIPVYTTCYGEVEGLPAAVEGTYYIVSALTAQAAVGRNDLLIVDGTVRNSEGAIVGCTAFGRV